MKCARPAGRSGAACLSKGVDASACESNVYIGVARVVRVFRSGRLCIGRVTALAVAEEAAAMAAMMLVVG